MSVIPSELILRPSSVMPESLATEDVGGAIGTGTISGAVVGEIFGSMPATGSQQVQYSKVFFENSNTLDDLDNSKIFLVNGLADGPGGNHTISVQSTSADDNSGKQVRLNGLNSVPEPDFELRPLNGTTEVFGATNFGSLLVATLHDVVTGELTPAVGAITIRKNGQVLGIIPPGYYSATREIDLGLASALDDTATSDDAATAPSGISFSRPTTFGAGLEVANSGTLSAEAAQGIWLRWTLAANRIPTPDVEIVLGIGGDSA